jgi:serine/threonine protein phosphatase PrpC
MPACRKSGDMFRLNRMQSDDEKVCKKLFSFSSPEEDESSLTLTASEKEPEIRWSCKQQIGFKYNEERMKLPLHDKCEDFYYPLEGICSSINGDKLFLLADGHAGHQAPNFFIRGVRDSVLQVLNTKKFDFSLESHQNEIKTRITQIYLDLDQEYTLLKTSEYQTWVENGSSPSKKPMDDGCTIILNIIQPHWVMNCNVGDSRTVISKQSQFSNGLYPIFSSLDHNMMHPGKIASIFNSGGKFLDHTGSLISVSQVDKNKKSYRELGSSRLFRPISNEIRAVGCSHRRTLNLTGTMGDLLFKIHPPILTSAPDITFIHLDSDYEHVLVMGTDGLWDHLECNTIESQNFAINNIVSEFLNFHLDQDQESNCSYLSELKDIQTTLDLCCEALVNREGDLDLFSQNLVRYDDCTVMLIHIE